MIFEIPEDLSVFTDAALSSMRDRATTEYNTLLASMQGDPAQATDDNLGDLESLKGFVDDAASEIAGRSTNAARLASHASIDTAVQVETVETVTPQTPETPEAFEPRVADLAPMVPAPEVSTVPTVAEYGKMYASANVATAPAGSELDLMGLTKAFISKVDGYAALQARGSNDVVSQQVAYIKRDYPAEFSIGGDEEADDQTLRRVTDEYRLDPGGLKAFVAKRQAQFAQDHPDRDALIAATGWCAPSETLYDTCFQGAIDGLYDAPEVQARRGGIRHNQGIDFTGVFGAGTGFFNLSEAQVIAGTNKTCIEIPCPSFVDDRLGVTGLCVTGNILQNRGYPEFVRDWMRAAMVVSAHQINSLQIADVVSGSTAVSLQANDPWQSDASVTSQLLAAVEMSIVDMKYRLRMSRTTTLEVVFPWWVLAQFRADMSRRNGGNDVENQSITDSQITSWFSMRGARVQFVLDWQDAFAPTDVIGGAALAPGAATAINQFPTGVKFLVYPSGTWVRAVSDVITLNAIYDSTKLVTNQLTQLFTETGWKMMRMCPLSRVYTINICPTGATAAQRAVDCSNP